MREEIVVPEGVSVEMHGKELLVRGPKGELKRIFSFHHLETKVIDNKILMTSEKDNKKVKRVFNTFISHIHNMIRGVQDPYVYKMKIKYVHFPMTVEKQGNFIIIKNFKGERKDRKARVMPETDVQIMGDEIVITSVNKEYAGQTAANIENTARIVGYDRRVFQDGIYITEKAMSSQEED
jgi:large subunit ribosomal protein L6